MNKFDRAVIFCKKAHDEINQVRKYTNEPYWVHPIEVMQIVKSIGGDENQLCAALLHDTVEDTKVTLAQIRAEFGDDVAELVEMLTDVSKKEDGNRAKRKAIDLAHTAKASPRAKTIKLADIISNCKNIIEYDPDFAVVYLAEKRKSLTVLKEGDPTLYVQASKIINDYFDSRRNG